MRRVRSVAWTVAFPFMFAAELLWELGHEVLDGHALAEAKAFVKIWPDAHIR